MYTAEEARKYSLENVTEVPQKFLDIIQQKMCAGEFGFWVYSYDIKPEHVEVFKAKGYKIAEDWSTNKIYISWD